MQGERVDREAALPPLYARFVGNLARTYGMKRVADWPLGSLDIRCLVFEVADPARRDATIAALAKEQFVESAQRVSGFTTSGEAARGGYNDPYRNLQPALDTMQVVESHRWATGKGVRVAVIDTGIDTEHPDLRERVVGIRNFVDREAVRSTPTSTAQQSRASSRRHRTMASGWWASRRKLTCSG